jgi:hypothetical protein
MNTTIKTLSALGLAAAALMATVGSSNAVPFRVPAGGFHCLACTTQTKVPPFRVPPGGFHCLACSVTHPTPPIGGSGHGSGNGRGWERGWDRWHYGFGRPEVVVGGQPAAVGAIATGGAVAAPAAGQAAGEPCNCLTKQTLPDGSVLFEDICTKQSAIAPPATVGSR